MPEESGSATRGSRDVDAEQSTGRSSSSFGSSHARPVAFAYSSIAFLDGTSLKLSALTSYLDVLRRLTLAVSPQRVEMFPANNVRGFDSSPTPMTEHQGS